MSKAHLTRWQPIGGVCAVLFIMLLVSCGGGKGGGEGASSTYSGPVTKANFKKLKGGMNEAEVEAILGKPTYADLNDNNENFMYVGNRGRMQGWRHTLEHGQEDIVVVYCEHKAVKWVWIGDGGRDRDEQFDMAYSYTSQFGGKPPPPNPDFKPDPKPDPKLDLNAKLTKAVLDSIVAGKTTRADVEAVLGPPTEVKPGGSLGKDKKPLLRLTWFEGTTSLSVYVYSDTGVVTGTASNIK